MVEAYRPSVGDFVGVGLPDLVCPERENGDRLAIQRHELDFVSQPFAVHSRPWFALPRWPCGYFNGSGLGSW